MTDRDGEMVIAPRRERGEARIPGCGLFFLNPAGAAREAVRIPGARQRFLFHSRLVVKEKSDATPPFFVAGPAVGAPMAVLTLEKLIALGARRIVVAGWCGSLLPDLAIGTVVLPTWARSEEGSSAHYPLAARPESAAPLRQQLGEHLAAAGMACRTGPVWTTDALYRESRAKVRAYGEEGILAVDMEYSGLAAVAAFRRVELAAALLVSDLLWPGKWEPGFRSPEFRKWDGALVGALLELAGNLAT